MVEVEYKRRAEGVQARLKLPESVTGELLWKGRSIALRSGEQTVALP